tara:strand:- start:15331 stop:15489 length:159 start_codon:yes stop_codon:yes gene_type:complete
MTAKVTTVIIILLLGACAPISRAKPTGSVGFTGVGGDRPVIFPADTSIWKAY